MAMTEQERGKLLACASPCINGIFASSDKVANGFIIRVWDFD